MKDTVRRLRALLRPAVSRLGQAAKRVPWPTLSVLDRLSIRAKLALGYGVVLGAMALLAATSTVLLSGISSANADAAARSAQVGHALRATGLAQSIRQAVLDSRVNNDPSRLADLAQLSADLRAAVEALPEDDAQSLRERVNAFLVTASEAQPLLESRKQLVESLLDVSAETLALAITELPANTASLQALSQVGQARAAHARFLRDGDIAALDNADAALQLGKSALEGAPGSDDALRGFDDYSTALVLLRIDQEGFQRVVVTNLDGEGAALLSELATLQTTAQTAGAAASESAATLAFTAKLVNGGLALIGLIIGIVLAVAVRNRILSSVRALSEGLAIVGRDMTFGHRIPVAANDELGQAAQASNRLFEALQQSFANVATTSQSMAAGDFNRALVANSPGDIGLLEASVEGTRQALSTSFTRIRDINDALSEGRFGWREELEGLHGDFLSTVWSANRTAETFERAGTAISECVAGLSRGEFTQRIEATLPGQLGDIAGAINHSLDGLQRAMDEIVATADALASGDLTRPMSGDFEGGLAVIQSSLNGSLGAMREVMGTVAQAAGAVELAGGRIATSADQLAEQAARQASFIEETAASVEEMGASIAQAATVAEEGSRNAQQSGALADSGRAAAVEATGSIHRLQKASKQIGEITQAIRAIAFQTNILALNAAVEAARAGEAGRGFAVVATEVRSLAQRADDATREIGERIGQTQVAVTHSLGQVGGVEEAINALHESTRSVANTFGHVATGAREQSLGIQQLNTAVLELDQMSQRMARIVDDTHAEVGSLNDVAEQLVASVRRFRLTSED
jgi:methyl-accepting chemotaxis protein